MELTKQKKTVKKREKTNELVIKLPAISENESVARAIVGAFAARLDPTLEELAELSCFSRTYFSALFKSLNGVSPWEYINIKRIEKAKMMLSETNDTILYIANECGFGNLSNFNRIFRKITGKKPSDYRK